jgi:uncharacterized protein YrrD
MMLVKRSEVIGREIVDKTTGRKMGRATNLFVDTETKRVAGLFYEEGNRHGLISRTSIAIYGQDVILIDKAQQESMPSSNHDPFINSRIVTRDGDVIGKLDDYYFDSMTGYVAGFVTTNRTAAAGKRSVIYGEYFESLIPDAVMVNKEAISSIELETDGTRERLLKRMKDKASHSLSELRDVTRAVLNKVKADLSDVVGVTRETFNLAVDQARSELQSTKDYTKEFLDRVTSSAKAEWEQVRDELGNFTEKLQRAAHAAWSELTNRKGSGKSAGTN